ncbi:hypothetical protein LP419_34915 [Massilia sp. H-1]|nr:hypothetical protein LP419_34915 [Massilia sp. H-1]
MKRASLAALLLWAALPQAQGAALLGIVTERAAPGAIEAAHRHLASHPGDRIMLRTPAQLMAASDRQLGQWVGQADSVLAVSVFGDPARRLKDALGRHARAHRHPGHERRSEPEPDEPRRRRQPARLPGRNAAPAGRRRAARRSAARGRRAPDRAPLAGRAPRVAGRHGADNVRALLAHQLDPQQALPSPRSPRPRCACASASRN